MLHRIIHGLLITPQPTRRIATTATVYLTHEKAIEKVRGVQFLLFYRQ